MLVRAHKKKGVTVLTLEGELTLGDPVTRLRVELKQQLAAGERSLVLDLAGVRYLDSLGVGEIVACHKRAVERGAVLKVVLPPRGSTRRIFDVLSLGRLVEIHEDEADARASFEA